MEVAPRCEIVARSWAVDVLVRRDDIEGWVSDARRFDTSEQAERWGQWCCDHQPHALRYRVVPSPLPPTIFELPQD